MRCAWRGRNMKKTLTLIALLVAFCGLSFGQVSLIPTTLSAAITSASTTTVVVAAATGLNSNSYAIAAGSSYLWVDGEYMSVSQVNGTTLTVVRGYGGSRAGTHASGAYVFVGPATFFSQSRPGLLPTGSCTRANMVASPRPDISTQKIFDCVGGVWTEGLYPQYGQVIPLAIPLPAVGATLYTGINTNGTAPATNHTQCTEMDVPYNRLVTGLGVLNGTGVSNGDKRVLILYDSAGNLLANSATAGAAASGATTYQQFAFTSKIYIVGPARYFGCLQSNGNTDTIRMLVTGQADTYLTTEITSTTFGTVPATITVPTTFTSAKGPFFEVY